MNEDAKCLSALKRIMHLVSVDNGSKLVLSSFMEKSDIQQGQFVIGLHPFADPMICVGYVVQVRKKVGAFGSDVILMRLANGKLQHWENQSFFGMLEEQETLARKIFKVLPENEDYSEGYWTHDNIHEIGFIVENSKSIPSDSTSNVHITVKNGDSVELISFI